MKRKISGSIIAFTGCLLFALTPPTLAFVDVQIIQRADGDIAVLTYIPDEPPSYQLHGTLEADAPPPPTIRRYDPWVDWSNDLNGDGVRDLMACGEHQKTGQVKCQSKDMLTGTVISEFNVLTNKFDVNTRPSYTKDFNNDNFNDFMFCGVKDLANASVVCLIRDIRTGARISKFEAIPPGMDERDSFSIDAYINTDGDSLTQEVAFKYRSASKRQVRVRVINPISRDVWTDFGMLNVNYNLYPSSPNRRDFDGDGADDVYACALNENTGQFLCQIKRGFDGTRIANIKLMTPRFYVRDYYLFHNFNTSVLGNEYIAWGYRHANKQPVVKITNNDGSGFASVTVLSPDYVPAY